MILWDLCGKGARVEQGFWFLIQSFTIDSSGGSKGGGRLRTKIFSISCTFSEKLVEIICWRPSWRVGAPFYRNSGSAPGLGFDQISKNVLISFLRRMDCSAFSVKSRIEICALRPKVLSRTIASTQILADPGFRTVEWPPPTDGGWSTRTHQFLGVCACFDGHL